MGYVSMGTDSHTLSAAIAFCQHDILDLWDGALLFLSEDGVGAGHRAESIFLTNIFINGDFNHIQSFVSSILPVEFLV